MMLYEKMRPDTFDGYIWKDESLKTGIQKWCQNPLDYPSIIFTGPSGCGKTTLAKIIANELAASMGAESKFVPASMCGVDELRELETYALTGFAPIKLIILDEAERFSRSAQEFLRNMIDKLSDADVRFILTANYKNKIIDPLLGRMIHFEIDRLDRDSFVDFVIDAALEAGLDVENEDTATKLGAIIERNYPNVRAALNAIQYLGIGVNGNLPVDVKSWAVSLLKSNEDFRPSLVSFGQVEYSQAYEGLFDYCMDNGRTDLIQVIARHVGNPGNETYPQIVFTACVLELREALANVSN